MTSIVDLTSGFARADPTLSVPAEAVAVAGFFYVNVVWGDEYLRAFTECSIPTLLASGNIPGTPNLPQSEFVIVAPDEAERQIRQSAIFPLLERTIRVTFLPMEVTSEQKYAQMSRGHSRAVEYVARRGYCVFLAPDAIASAGMMRRLYDLASRGQKVVAGFGPRVNQAAMMRALRSLPQHEPGSALAVAPRELVSLTMAHLHRDLRHHFVDSQFFPTVPNVCVWPGPDGDGMLIRSLNLHPYLFDTRLLPEGRIDWRTTTIDWSLIPRFVTDWNDLYVEKDSDHFCIVGMAPEDLISKPEQPNRLEEKELSLFILRHRHEMLNRCSFLYPIAFHARSLDVAWEALVAQTGTFARNVVDPGGTLRPYTLMGRMIASLKEDRQETNREQDYPDKGEPMAGIAESTLPMNGSASAGLPTPVPFFYSCAVWGRQYADFFCRFAIASLLSPKNFPALTNNGVSTFFISTTRADQATIEASTAFRVLSSLIKVEFLPFATMNERLPGPDDRDDKYSLLMLSHAVVAQRAMGRGCAIYLGPDAIYSDGFLSCLLERAQQGYETVVGMGLRVNEETIVPQLEEQQFLREGEPLVMQPRQAVGFLVEHLHEDARVMRWNCPHFPAVPYMGVWDVGGGDGLLVRSFSLHPYLIDYRHIAGWRASPRETAIDANYLQASLIPFKRVYQVTDSDEFTILSLTPMQRREYQWQSGVDPAVAVRNSAYRHDISMMNRMFFMNGIKFHIGDLDHRWMQLERDTLHLAYVALARPFDPPPPQVPTDTLVNQYLSGDAIGVSSRLVIRTLLRKVMRRLGLSHR